MLEGALNKVSRPQVDGGGIADGGRAGKQASRYPGQDRGS